MVNTNKKIISIVIGCYNQACFLREAIQSCVNQHYQNLEVIVVDDGSTDATESVAKQFPNVEYIWQRNQGVSAARNAGFSKSTGTYLVFLDGDDRLLPNAIQHGLSAFSATPNSGFVVGRYHKIDATGAPIGQPNRMCEESDYYCALLKGNVVGMLSSVLFRRVALDAVGGFDRRFRASEDYDILLRIAKTYSVAEHNNLVAEYRWHGSNMSQDILFLFRDTLDALLTQWPYAKQNPQYRRAFKTGIANWRRYYSSLLFSELVKEAKVNGSKLSAFTQLVKCMRSNPTIIPAIMGRATNWLFSWTTLRACRTAILSTLRDMIVKLCKRALRFDTH